LYLFEGTGIVVQFNDYAVIRLVEKTAPNTTTFSTNTATTATSATIPTTSPVTTLPITHIRRSIKLFSPLLTFLLAALLIIIVFLLHILGWLRSAVISWGRTPNINSLLILVFGFLVTLILLSVILGKF
jgi:hypothetical protein